MTVLERTIAPPFKTIDQISWISPEHYEVEGLDVYGYRSPGDGVVKAELVVEAGSAGEEQALSAKMTSALLLAGTDKYSAHEIAEKIDALGAFIEVSQNKDFFTIQLYSLSRNFSELLNIIAHVVDHASFPPREFDIIRNNEKMKFKVQLEKVDVLARRAFANTLFPEGHPYTTKVHLESFDALSNSDVRHFHETRVKQMGWTVFLAGDYSDQDVQHLGALFTGSGERNAKVTSDQTLNSGRITVVEKTGAVQSAIRMGKEMPGRLHSDYAGLQVANTIIGGYFGSRLMNNIREDKGYTYGIGSRIYAQTHGSYFMIGTEVGTDVTQAAIDEIVKELKQLIDVEVGAGELEVVKNYMNGQLLKATDGIFARMELYKQVHYFDLPDSYFEDFFSKVNECNPQIINKLCADYFQPSDMCVVVAGDIGSVSI